MQRRRNINFGMQWTREHKPVYRMTPYLVYKVSILVLWYSSMSTVGPNEHVSFRFVVAPACLEMLTTLPHLYLKTLLHLTVLPTEDTIQSSSAENWVVIESNQVSPSNLKV